MLGVIAVVGSALLLSLYGCALLTLPAREPTACRRDRA
jgi:hypothetical protein